MFTVNNFWCRFILPIIKMPACCSQSVYIVTTSLDHLENLEMFRNLTALGNILGVYQQLQNCWGEGKESCRKNHMDQGIPHVLW